MVQIFPRAVAISCPSSFLPKSFSLHSFLHVVGAKGYIDKTQSSENNESKIRLHEKVKDYKITTPRMYSPPL